MKRSFAVEDLLDTATELQIMLALALERLS